MVRIDDSPCMTPCMKAAATHTVAEPVLTCQLDPQEANNDSVRVVLPQSTFVQDIA